MENGLEELTGFWSGLTAGDFDHDGDVDFVVGNLGTNTKLRKQVDGKLRMLIKDVDKNETEEHIIGYNRVDDWYPINSKDEIGKQIPSIISKKYTKYKDFAGNTIEELFGDNELKGATERLVNTFESIYLENKGQGKFERHDLPALAQVSKVMVLRAEDVDKDGHLDVILGGNFNGASMYQARYDAFFGLILKGDGKGGFKALVPTDTGFLQEGDVRDIKIVQTPKGPLYFVTRNSDRMQVFKKLN
jgi:predicted nucleotidyltransferase